MKIRIIRGLKQKPLVYGLNPPLFFIFIALSVMGVMAVFSSLSIPAIVAFIVLLPSTYLAFRKASIKATSSGEDIPDGTRTHIDTTTIYGGH